MAKRVKCRYCEEFLNKEDSVLIIEKTKTGKEKRIFLHKECKEKYIELMKYKENEIKWFNELYNHIKGVLGYSSNQKLPRFLVIRIQDLRNGTIMQKGVGRVTKSKEGYRYEIILNTFLKCSDNIRWALSNRRFKNEHQKINYIMAIIDANINDTYIEMRNKNTTKQIEKRKNLIDENNIILNTKRNIKPKINKGGIAQFLKKDEL